MKYEVVSRTSTDLETYLNGPMFRQGTYALVQVLKYRGRGDWTILVKLRG